MPHLAATLLNKLISRQIYPWSQISCSSKISLYHDKKRLDIEDAHEVSVTISPLGEQSLGLMSIWAMRSDDLFLDCVLRFSNLSHLKPFTVPQISRIFQHGFDISTIVMSPSIPNTAVLFPGR